MFMVQSSMSRRVMGWYPTKLEASDWLLPCTMSAAKLILRVHAGVLPSYKHKFAMTLINCNAPTLKCWTCVEGWSSVNTVFTHVATSRSTRDGTGSKNT